MFSYAGSKSRYVLTQKGMQNTPDWVKGERKIGEIITGYEKKVPKSWVSKGYVTKVKI